MEQDSELASNGDHGLVLGLLASSFRQMQFPSPERRVFCSWPEDVVRALDQQASQIDVGRLGDAELRIAIS
jgi:hypothetical protein